jgi:hypothetical protein
MVAPGEFIRGFPADIAGIQAVLVHTISEEVRRFYERCGFAPSPVDRMTVMIALRDAAQAMRRIEQASRKEMYRRPTPRPRVL